MIDVVTAESSKLPVLIDADGALLYEPTRWLLSLNQRGKKAKQVRKIAYTLRSWCIFLSSQGIGLEEAVTGDFRKYRDKLKSEGNQNDSVNQHTQIPLDFYWWAQDKGLYRRMAGWRDFERPTQDFQIQVDRPVKKSRKEFKNPFLLKTHNKPLSPMLEADKVKRLRIEISKRTRRAKGVKDVEALDARNQLMLNWMTEAALREEEVAQLLVSGIPARKSGNPAKLVPVVIDKGTKFDKPRTVKVREQLIADTHDFIEMEREDLIDDHLSGKDPGVLFVSTGEPGLMSTDNIYKMVTGAAMDITPHDLRGYSLYNYAISLYSIERLLAKESGDKRRIDRSLIEMKLKRQAGHESLDTTLKNYVDLAEVVTATEENVEALDQEISQLEIRLALLKEMKAGKAD
jgi:site-specific recombinase XerD